MASSDWNILQMTYVQAISGGGGWPMSVFLTPTLEPIVGISSFFVISPAINFSPLWYYQAGLGNIMTDIFQVQEMVVFPIRPDKARFVPEFWHRALYTPHLNQLRKACNLSL